MVEVIDRENKNKFVALILCTISYDSIDYVVYSVRREKDNANVFVSKVVQNSEGLTFDDDFFNGEKEVVEGFVRRILNKEEKSKLEQDGIQFKQEVHFEGSHYFDIEKCYVTTISVSYIKECLMFYQLFNKEMLNRPVVSIKEDTRKFNEGFVSNVALIIMGIVILLFCFGVLYEVFLK